MAYTYDQFWYTDDCEVLFMELDGKLEKFFKKLAEGVSYYDFDCDYDKNKFKLDIRAENDADLYAELELSPILDKMLESGVTDKLIQYIYKQWEELTDFDPGEGYTDGDDWHDVDDWEDEEANWRWKAAAEAGKSYAEYWF